MEKKMEKIKNKIETLIEWANDSFKKNGWDNSHELKLAKIDGLVQALEILTEKEYYYDENGLHERQ